jgi:excisionase family DNA binding protein
MHERARGDGPRLISVPEAAENLGISRRMAYLLAARGDIATCRIGRRVLVPVAELHAYVERQTVRGKGL